MIKTTSVIIQELHKSESHSARFLRQIVEVLQSHTDTSYSPDKQAAEANSNSHIPQRIHLDPDKTARWRYNFDLFTSQLKESSLEAQALNHYFFRLTKKSNFIRAVTELGISSGDGFLTSITRIFTLKILPEIYKRDDFQHLITDIFRTTDDLNWLYAITHNQWSKFFKAIHLREVYTLDIKHTILRQMLNSIQVISLRINTIGVDQEIIRKFPQLERFESPFMAQHKEITNYIEHYLSEDTDRTIDNQNFKHIMVLLEQCEDYAAEIRKKRAQFGVTFKMTSYLIQLRENIHRLKTLLLIVTVHHEDILFKEEVNLLRDLVRGSFIKRQLSRYMRRHFELTAYQVTEHAGETGEAYITTDAKSYYRMFISACGGGVIVGFLSIFKLLYSYLGFPLFGSAFMYSMNYSLGFILIHMTGSKLATKQPAMTATNLANSLDKGSNLEQNLNDLAEKTVNVFRSQFISFVGNVLFAFPVACAIAMFYFLFFDEHIATPARASYMIHELHPLKSLAIFHAAITGVYLYASGLISGYVENLSRVSNFPERLGQNPFLLSVFSQRSLLKISKYLDHNVGAISGNFALGIFLGSTSTIGYILGLPIDIRHITFSAANFGIAFISKGADIPVDVIVTASMGIALIGLTNFLVSFSLALTVAIKSRGVSFGQLANLLLKVGKLFLRYPSTFFIPFGLKRLSSSTQKEVNL